MPNETVAELEKNIENNWTAEKEKEQDAVWTIYSMIGNLHLVDAALKYINEENINDDTLIINGAMNALETTIKQLEDAHDVLHDSCWWK